jgi:4'-phosphopantetheinyl transferase
MLISTPLCTVDYELKNNRVDIWQFPLTSESSEIFKLLNDSERNRSQRFYFPKHQRRFTNAHGILRLIIGRYIDQLPTALEFTTGPHGKPALSNDTMLQFNLSHSGEMALLAIGKHEPLGIDLEYFSARPYLGIGDHLFSMQETQALLSTPAALKPLVFFNIWAQKEAFIKAIGLGLSYPTQQFDVPILSSSPHIVIDHLHNTTWQLLSFTPEIACCASLCCSPSVQEIRYTKLTSAELKQFSTIFAG